MTTRRARPDLPADLREPFQEIEPYIGRTAFRLLRSESDRAAAELRETAQQLLALEPDATQIPHLIERLVASLVALAEIRDLLELWAVWCRRWLSYRMSASGVAVLRARY
jgi:hypothetical protein